MMPGAYHKRAGVLDAEERVVLRRRLGLVDVDRRAGDFLFLQRIRQRKLIKVLTSGPDPEQLAVSADGKEVYIANEDTAQFSVIDSGDGHLIQSFKVGDEPEGVTVEKLTAEYMNGVLEITAPVAAAALPRKIEIKATAPFAAQIAA